MSKKDKVREFLISRRAHVTPEQVGLPDVGERRVPGLRREEVATLAGVSVDYYTQLERGNLRGASDSVLNAIARALQLNDVEREYLFDLARGSSATAHRRGRKAAKRSVRASVQRVLDNMAVPAIVAGIRVATVSTIGLVTVGFIIGKGGLGEFIIDGLNRFFTAEVIVGAVLSVALALTADGLLLLLERRLTPWIRAGRAREDAGPI